MKNPHDVILRPVLTEASYDGFADKRYVFEVHPSANKTEIKLALESIFKGIKVDKVNTLRTLGKMKRQGRTAGRTRHMGIRPTVRGVVMNPCDHPHGGGEGKSPVGMPAPVTPWGKVALGLKTRKHKKYSNKMIVKRAGK